MLVNIGASGHLAGKAGPGDDRLPMGRHGPRHSLVLGIPVDDGEDDVGEERTLWITLPRISDLDGGVGGSG